MGKISVSTVNGSLTSKRSEVIPVLNWKLNISQTPEKIKFRTLYTRKKKLLKGAFINIDGLPTAMTYKNTMTSGTATVMIAPTVGKVYSAFFKTERQQSKIFANVYITQTTAGKPSQIEFIVLGQITIGPTKRTKKRRKRK